MSSAHNGTQTEPQNGVEAVAAEQLQHDGLKEFLQRVEDDVVQQLVRNDKSHAFDGFHVNWEDRSDRVSKNSGPESSCHSLPCKSCYGLGCSGFSRCHAFIAFNIPVQQKEASM